MVSKVKNQFMPDYAVPPGETLLETLEAIGMSQADLAQRTGRPKKTINEIIKGKAAITPETALQLERVLSVPASLWNNLERDYRETLARLEEQQQLQKHLNWLKQMPVKAMVERGWIAARDDPVQQIQEICRFLGVASPSQWQTMQRSAAVAFRQSRAFESDPVSVSVWLRQGELEAQKIECAPYSARRFRKSLAVARSLTVEPPETLVPQLADLCAQAGVSIVFVQELPKLRTSGATRWLTPGKAMIQLGLRYKTNDHLWFTVFHEAAHILLHGKREVFVEGDNVQDDKEQAADRFAANTLIPSNDYQRFVKEGRFSSAAIEQFADQVSIAPGIVVGRLQHDGHLDYSACNDLKVKLTWSNGSNA